MHREGTMRTLSILSTAAVGLLLPAAGQAQGMDFFKGKPLAIITSTGAGGPYDLVARVVAKYMTRNLPGNPSAIIQNMPGAGHVLATNYMYNQAAQDGTVIAIVANSIPLHQMINGKGVRYD